MSDDHANHGTAWVRLRSRLRRSREDLATSILSGDLEREDYLRRASRVAQIDETLVLMDQIATGADRVVKREQVLHVEER